jgi:hypothetical protein
MTLLRRHANIEVFSTSGRGTCLRRPGLDRHREAVRTASDSPRDEDTCVRESSPLEPEGEGEATAIMETAQ